MKTKNKTTVTVFILLIAVTIVFTGTYFALSGREKNKETEEIKALIAKRSNLIFAGVNVPVIENEFTAKLENGRQVAVVLDNTNQAATVEQSDFKGLFVFASDAQNVTITAAYGDDIAFEGTLEDFDKFVPESDGEYRYEIYASFKTDEFEGSCRYCINVLYNTIPEFYLIESDVTQGDIIVLTGENVRGDVEISLDFDYTPFLVFSKAGCTGYIPINFMRQPGQHKAVVTYQGQITELAYNITEGEYEVQQLTIPPSVSDATVNNSDAQKEWAKISEQARNSYDENIYWTEPFLQPVEGRISSTYGVKRYTNGASTPSRHAGIDIACAEGTPVAAANAGKIVYSGYVQVTGNTVIIEHGMGLHSVYMHMSSLNCETDQTIGRGDIIGEVGATGYANGPHLHFDFQIGGYSVNPWPLFDGSSEIFDTAQTKIQGTESGTFMVSASHVLVKRFAQTVNMLRALLMKTEKTGKRITSCRFFVVTRTRVELVLPP